jgi:hypothetical protein
VRIDPPKTVSAPLAEGQEITAIHRRGPRELASEYGSHSGSPPLQLGQELEVSILEELDGGRLLLKIGTTLIEADNPGGLAAGQQVRLRVEQLQPNVVLHIMDVEPTIEAQAARLLRSHLPAHADSGELLDALQRELTALVGAEPNALPTLEKFIALRASIASLLAGNAPITAEGLDALMHDGGLFYEAKLFAATGASERMPEIAGQDLKGLLLAALQESKAGAFPSGLQHALSAQLENLETQQAVNLVAQLNGGAFQMQIPFFTGAGLTTVALAVERDGRGSARKSRKEDEDFSLLFLLDLEHFGRTRVDAHINVGKLHAIFYVDRPASVRIIQEELTGFSETLVALGYHDVLLAAKPLREMSREKQEKFAALAVGAPPSIHLLDMKA